MSITLFIFTGGMLMWQPEDDFWELAQIFYRVGPQEVVRLGGKHLDVLSHLAGLFLPLK